MTEAANINIDDRVLVEHCKQGDSKAMERIIRKYQNRIYNIILKMCANADDAAELTQETFVKVIENIGRFEGRSSFYTWLFKVATNLTLTHCQRKVKLGFSSLESEYISQNEQAAMTLKDFLADDNAQDPAKLAQNKELAQLIVAALMKLDDDQRAVVVLRDIEGMNYAQIAAVLDIELGTVKSRIARARNNLRNFLEAVLQ